MTQDSYEEQDGQIAYNAYGDHASWQTYDGRPMPRWDQLGDAVQSHWVAAAARVARRTLANVSRETSTDDVYRERAHLVSYLATAYPSTIGYLDPTEPDWAVVIVETPAGQMSWHVAPGDMDLFRHIPRTETNTWDGHSTPQKYERLRKLIGAALTMTPDVSRETSTKGGPDGA